MNCSMWSTNGGMSSQQINDARLLQLNSVKSFQMLESSDVRFNLSSSVDAKLSPRHSAKPGRFWRDPRWWKSRPGSTQEMVEFGDTLKMKTLQRHFAHPKPHPPIVFYQASSVPIVNQAVISLIPGFKVIGMCMLGSPWNAYALCVDDAWEIGKGWVQVAVKGA